jgi:SAM-dependent methyltransferase
MIESSGSGQGRPPVNWQSWLHRWDAMQTAYVPEREDRFQAMFDLLGARAEEAGWQDTLVAVDLACGPGAISRRLLERFPRARCVGVDFDPALLALGQGALGDLGGRLHWVEADLRDPTWLERLGESSVDAVLSSTALHWLDSSELTRLLRQMATLIRPGGVFLNGDHIWLGPQYPALGQVVRRVKERRQGEAMARAGAEDWRHWWREFAAEPEVEQLVLERDRRYALQGDEPAEPITEFFLAGLYDAGFLEAAIVWQSFDHGVLMAIR